MRAVRDSPRPAQVGTEWLVDAHGCSPDRLERLEPARDALDRVVADLELQVLERVWHRFGPPGGVTGLYLLTESHLACHTYPESGIATFNLYCCRPRPEWPWADRLAGLLGATSVVVRRTSRGESPPAAAPPIGRP